MAKSKVMDRPMFKGMMPDEPVMDVENVGIMQGFQDILGDEGEDYDEDEYETGAMMGRTPDSPEILMNNLRGDMRSVDARREELADLVGTAAAMETPDSVLAMLQPVLAQQGIGSLPPPPAAMPGAMPPAMPPAPMPAAQGPMPPPPGMPPGGIAGMPPLQMAKGGIVQRFSEGSDEEGVTQATDSSSGFASFPADMTETSRQYIYDYLGQQPAVVPELRTLAQKRAKEFADILGTDTRSADAQMLLELAQRAFGYAANVDEQGRPLRGSPASRFAGAFRTLPGALAKYESEQAKEGRAVKLAGIQAAEKERESIRDANAKLIESKRKIHTEIVKKAGGPESMFGKGAWEWRVVNTPNLLARYGKNETDEDETNLVESAISKLSQPRIETKTDPDTGLPYQVSVPAVIPGFVTDAKKARAGTSLAPPAAAAVSPTAPRATTPAAAAPRAAAPATAPAAAAPAPNVGAPVATATPVQAPAGTGVQLPPSMRGPRPTIEAPGTSGALPGRTLWGESTRIAGPGAAVTGAISTIPGLGAPFPEVTQAQNLAKQEVENLIEAFLKSGRAPASEQERLLRLYSVGPKFWDDPAAYRDRLIAIDEEIAKEINLAKNQAFNETLSSEDRKNARSFLVAAEKFRSTLGVPLRIYNEEDAAKLPPGTPYLWKGKFPAVRGGGK